MEPAVFAVVLPELFTPENACCRVGQLAVNGRDLMALGAKPGPGLRGQLEALLEAVITGQLPNERQALLAAVKIELDP